MRICTRCSFANRSQRERCTRRECSRREGIDVLQQPRHPYTRALLDALPHPEAAQDTPLGALVVRLGQELVRPPELVREQRNKDAVDARVAAAEPVELPSQHAHRLGRLERIDGRRTRLGGDEREFAERFARRPDNE